jgi:hypothetical protein
LKIPKDKTILIGTSGWILLVFLLIIVFLIGPLLLSKGIISNAVIIIGGFCLLSLFIVLLLSLASLIVVFGHTRTIKNLYKDNDITLDEFKTHKRNGLYSLVVNGAFILITTIFLTYFFKALFQTTMGI